MYFKSNGEDVISEKKRSKWIDAVKAVAIIAVVIDHSFGTLYTNRWVWLSTYFSVSVFVFMAGVTNYYSCENHHNTSIKEQTFRRINKMVMPYAVATAIYQIAIYKCWNLKEYINFILGFNITPPFYFVVFFIQLIFVSPYLYRILQIKLNSKGKTIIKQLVVFELIVIISVLNVKYTFVVDVWGGGKYIMGGSYLILFFMGQMAVFFKIFDKIEVKFIYCVFSFIMIFLCLLWIKRYEFLLDNWLHNPFGDGINPSGITLIIYSVCIVGFLYLFFTLIQRCSNPLVVIIYDFFSGIGKHSLYIFLYHRLILDRLLVPYINIDNIWIRRTIFICMMIGIPIGINIMFDFLKKTIGNYIRI